MGCHPCNLKEKKVTLLKPETIIKIDRSMMIQGYDTDPFLRYQQIMELGEGSYGKVYKVFDKIGKTYRALKVIKKSTTSKADEEKMLKEIDILKMLDHPNIVKIFEFYNTKSRYYIITELLSGGELFNKISNKKNLEEPVALHVMKQILCAVNYCHGKKVIHGDLKPENILLEDDEKFFNVKIIDFGTSVMFKDKEWLEKQIGTPYYVAPEILENNYNEKCDIWSCGVIMYILLSGSPPFKGTCPKEIFKSVKSGIFNFKHERWNNVSKGAKDLITKLLEFDINKRYTAEEALNHHIMRNVGDQGDSCSETQVDTTNTCQSTVNMISIHKNWEKYKVYKNLQKATLYFIIHNCTNKSELSEIRKLFVKFDSNCDGKLTMEEFSDGIKSCCKYIKTTDTELESLMTGMDLDKSGYIDYEEFLTATYNPALLLTDKNLQSAFDLFDKDKSGKISADELKQVLGVGASACDNKVWNKIISEVDLDGDKEISFDEFKKMMCNINNI
jgi:calcium-dependent protein kinase